MPAYSSSRNASRTHVGTPQRIENSRSSFLPQSQNRGGLPCPVLSFARRPRAAPGPLRDRHNGQRRARRARPPWRGPSRRPPRRGPSRRLPRRRWLGPPPRLRPGHGFGGRRRRRRGRVRRLLLQAARALRALQPAGHDRRGAPGRRDANKRAHGAAPARREVAAPPRPSSRGATPRPSALGSARGRPRPRSGSAPAEAPRLRPPSLAPRPRRRRDFARSASAAAPRLRPPSQVQVVRPSGAPPGTSLEINVEGRNYYVPVPPGVAEGGIFLAKVPISAQAPVAVAAQQYSPPRG